MSLFEHFFKVLSLYLESRIRIWIRIKVIGGRFRIRIRIKVTSRFRIRIKVTSRIRIRIKVIGIRNTGLIPTDLNTEMNQCFRTRTLTHCTASRRMPAYSVCLKHKFDLILMLCRPATVVDPLWRASAPLRSKLRTSTTMLPSSTGLAMRFLLRR